MITDLRIVRCERPEGAFTLIANDGHSWFEVKTDWLTTPNEFIGYIRELNQKLDASTEQRQAVGKES